MTERSGSAAIFGEEAPADDRLVEPLYRDSFAQHLKRNLPKLAAGLEPEDPPVSLSFDGHGFSEYTTIILIKINYRTW